MQKMQSASLRSSLADSPLHELERLEQLSSREDLHTAVIFSDSEGRKKSAALLCEIENAMGVVRNGEDADCWLDDLDGVL